MLTTQQCNIILQPLTVLPEKKCKRCGVYKLDILKDDVFDEWELCPADFVNGNYGHFKAKEFNATFRCPLCTASETGEWARFLNSFILLINPYKFCFFRISNLVFYSVIMYY